MSNQDELQEISAPVYDPVIAPGRTLAIVGSHPKGLALVPWDDEAVDILVFNEAPLKPEKYPRWSACLQIHGPEVYAQEHNWVNENYWQWLQQPHGKPIYMQEVDPRVPDSVKYPLDKVLALVPYRYLRSSPAMALALGIVQGYSTILLYGSELTSNTEYAYQATNYAFWIGFAHGCGIDVQLKCWQSEFYQEIYGYDGELQLERSYFERRRDAMTDAYNQNQAALDKHQNEIDAAMLKNDFDAVSRMIPEIESIALAAGETFACMAEARRYSERQNMISRQEFERASARAQIDGDKLRSNKDHAGGKLEYVWNAWKLTGRNEALNQVRAFLRELRNLSFATGEKYGTFRENINYLAEYDAKLQAAGGARALGRAE
jgi:hypothetical protein